MDRIYAIQNAQTKTAYIGRTYRALMDRWSEHLEAAAKGADKTLYEYMRMDPDGFQIVELEYSETATEAEWLDAYTQDGWTILNDTGANSKQPKKRDVQKERTWRLVNENARVGSYGMPNGQTVHEFIRDLTYNGPKRIAERWEKADPGYFAKLRASVPKSVNKNV